MTFLLRKLFAENPLKIQKNNYLAVFFQAQSSWKYFFTEISARSRSMICTPKFPVSGLLSICFSLVFVVELNILPYLAYIACMANVTYEAYLAYIACMAYVAYEAYLA